MNGTRVGYARCSTDEQDVLVQTEQLQALGVEPDRIYIDRGFSGTTCTNRAGLDQALAAVWDGNVFTVTKFDRFARNLAEEYSVGRSTIHRVIHRHPAPDGTQSSVPA